MQQTTTASTFRKLFFGWSRTYSACCNYTLVTILQKLWFYLVFQWAEFSFNLSEHIRAEHFQTLSLLINYFNLASQFLLSKFLIPCKTLILFYNIIPTGNSLWCEYLGDRSYFFFGVMRPFPDSSPLLSLTGEPPWFARYSCSDF